MPIRRSSAACSPRGAEKAQSASSPTLETMLERMGFVSRRA